MIDVFTEEAICVLYGLDIMAEGYEESQLEDVLTEKAEENGMVYMLADLIERLCDLATVAKSPITGAIYRGFSHPEKDHQWLVKKEYDPESEAQQ